ncbi:hypothetical protein CF137_16320 [Aeromonas sobria]|nr:hypothetical protein CF137_16320 [Aeromonas sobria]
MTKKIIANIFFALKKFMKTNNIIGITNTIIFILCKENTQAAIIIIILIRVGKRIILKLKIRYAVANAPPK